MSMSNASETALLNLLFTNTPWAGVGDAGGLQPSVAPGSYFVALHTADPGEAGTQLTNEIAYTGYARVAVVRSAVGWTVSGAMVSNTAQVQYGQCTAGSGTASHFSIGMATSGAGSILLKGALNNSLAISNGITPLFAAGVLTATVD